MGNMLLAPGFWTLSINFGIKFKIRSLTWSAFHDSWVTSLKNLSSITQCQGPTLQQKPPAQIPLPAEQCWNVMVCCVLSSAQNGFPSLFYSGSSSSSIKTNSTLSHQWISFCRPAEPGVCHLPLFTGAFSPGCCIHHGTHLWSFFSHSASCTSHQSMGASPSMCSGTWPLLPKVTTAWPWPPWVFLSHLSSYSHAPYPHYELWVKCSGQRSFCSNPLLVSNVLAMTYEGGMIQHPSWGAHLSTSVLILPYLPCCRTALPAHRLPWKSRAQCAESSQAPAGMAASARASLAHILPFQCVLTDPFKYTRLCYPPSLPFSAKRFLPPDTLLS